MNSIFFPNPPSIGTICEAKHPLEGGWLKIRILDCDGEMAVCRDDNDRLWWAQNFRPIKTPEQIAAEGRDKTVEEMRNVVKKRLGDEVDANWSYTYNILQALYDDGYRKFEIMDEQP